jgi:hypothetical protein
VADQLGPNCDRASRIGRRAAPHRAGGAGCLPLALRATSAPAHSPRGRPNGLLAATLAVACGAANGAIPPAPAS